MNENCVEALVRSALDCAWSLESTVQWSAENPANGQCNVTAAVVYELFGGEIFRTRYPTFWHYYNRINGNTVDLTDSQFWRPGARFKAPDNYDDELNNLAAAVDGIPQKEFDALKKALIHQIGMMKAESGKPDQTD